MIKNNESIKYIGNVTIKEYNGDKLIRTTEVHNNGTNWLFKVLALALTGSDQRQNMPHFLDMGSFSSGEFSSVLSARVGLTSKVVSSITKTKDGQTEIYGHSAIFTAVIPAANIIGSGEVTCYQLASTVSTTESSTVLAEVQVGGTTKHTYKQLAGYTYIVEWVMSFANEFSSSNSNDA